MTLMDAQSEMSRRQDTAPEPHPPKKVMQNIMELSRLSISIYDWK